MSAENVTPIRRRDAIVSRWEQACRLLEHMRDTLNRIPTGEEGEGFVLAAETTACMEQLVLKLTEASAILRQAEVIEAPRWDAHYSRLQALGIEL